MGTYIVNKTFLYSNEVGGVPDRVMSSSTCGFFSIFEVRGGNLKKNTFWKKWSERILRTKT